MSRLRRSAYFIEPFIYRGRGIADARERPTVAIGLLLSGGSEDPVCTPPATRQARSISLAVLGAVRDWDDDRDNDHFLPHFDHGHLFGAQYGGCDENYNLVPMLRRTNRGGAWAAFEAAIANAFTPAILVMRCKYSAVDDPRIPASVEAALVPVDVESGRKLNDAWDDWRRTLHAIVRNAAPNMVGQRVASQLRPAIRTDEANVKSASFTQDPFQLVGPPLRLSNVGLFIHRVRQAIAYINASGWAVENDPRARHTRSAPAPQPNVEFLPRFSLPPLAYRPYAALDLLALAGGLDGLLEGGDDGNIDIADIDILTTATFNAEMRSFAKYMNWYVHQATLSRQTAYLSDAAAHPVHPDPGLIGDGLVLDPEFDHVIPRELDTSLGWPGPTMFSNLQLTSPLYNTRKNNNAWVQPAVTVGEIRRIVHATRGATRRATAEGDVNRLRHK